MGIIQKKFNLIAIEMYTTEDTLYALIRLSENN